MPSHDNVVSMDLASGSRGQAVKDWQTRLNGWGFGPLVVDGVFGAKTKAAVENLQRLLEIDVTGAIDALTRGAVTQDLRLPGSRLTAHSLQQPEPRPRPRPDAVAEADPPVRRAGISPLLLLLAGVVALWWLRRPTAQFADLVSGTDDSYVPPERRLRAPRRRRERKQPRPVEDDIQDAEIVED